MPWSIITNFNAIIIRSLSLISKFTLLLFMAYYLPESDMGQYGLIIAISAYAVFFIGLEYYNYVCRIIIGASPQQQAAIIRDQFVLYAIVFILLSPILFIIYHTNVLPPKLVYFFVPITIAEHISTELMRLLNVLAKAQVANVVFFIRQGSWIFIALPIMFFYPNLRDLDFVLLMWLLGVSFSIVFALPQLGLIPFYKNKKLNIPIDWQEIKNGLFVSSPFIITAFCALSMLYLERFFINYYRNAAELGIYTLYSSISVALHNLVHSGVAKMRFFELLSAAKENSPNNFIAECKKLLKHITFFVILLLCVCSLLITPLITLLNKESYLIHQSIFYYLLFAAACRSIADAPLYMLYAKHKDILLLNLNLGAFVILLIGNIMLIPNYGIYGAAVSSMVASLILLISALFNANKLQLRILNLQSEST